MISATLDPRLIAAAGGPVPPGPAGEVAGLLQAGSSSGYGLGSAYSSEQGSWGAAPLANVASYQVGTFTGSFETSYPLATPPPAAGSAPSASLGYSSGSIDGMATDTNNQASPVGLGWSLAAGGSITRHYTTGCEGYENTAPGEFCPLGHEYTLSLNGVGSRLVLESETTTGNYVATFRLEADPMWRIQLFNEDSAATFANEDAHDEYWVVTTPDGTVYEFGKSADSVDYAPVHTAGQTQSKFDCDGYEDEDHDDLWLVNNDPDTPLGQTCQKAWRWNLSQVIDLDGNTVTYSYTQEMNWYGLRNGNDEAEYVAASHLSRIEYTGGGLTARVRVVFHTELRCSDPLTTGGCNSGADFVDTPVDLVCRDAAACDSTSFPAPSFFSERRLDAIETQVRVGSDWDTVQWWTLDHLFLDGSDEDQYAEEADSEPKLWLSAVTQRPDLTTASSGRVAYVQIEGEDWDSSNGTFNKQPASDYGTGRYVNNASTGEWLRFNDVDFGGGANSVLVRYAKDNTGGTVKFRLDDADTGTVIASFSPSSTGGWQSWDTQLVSLSSTPVGVHDVYVTFAKGNEDEVVHLNWFRLRAQSNTLVGLPPTDYGLAWLKNRAEDEDDIADRGASPMWMPRLDQVDLPLGGRVTVSYGTPYGWNSGGACDEEAVYGEDERLPCHFYGTRYQGVIVRYAKYVVTQIKTVDSTTQNASTWTRYEYSEPAWRYSDIPGHNNFTTAGVCATEPCNRWSDFRGHGWVKVTGHDGQGTDYATTEQRFYQGMDDDFVIGSGTWTYSATVDVLNPNTGGVSDSVTDYPWLVGRPLQTISYDAGYSNALTNTETTYSWFTTTPAQGQLRGRFVGVNVVTAETFGTETLTSQVDYDYDSTYGHVTKESHLGQTNGSSPAGDEWALWRDYTAANTGKWIIHAVSNERTRDGLSGTDPLLSWSDFYYDNQPLGEVGVKGRLTKTETKLNGSEWATTVYSYDAYGRVTRTADASDDHIVQTAYDATYGYVSEINDAGAGVGGADDQETTIDDWDPGFGLPIAVTDPNGNTITAGYDQYGRLTDVWLPTESTSGEPTIVYEYTIDPADYPGRVKTSQLTDTAGSGTYLESWTFYDGFGQPAQTQAPSAGDGKHWIVTTGYSDTQGLLRRQSEPFERVLASAVNEPGYWRVDWTDNVDPSLQTVYTYDAFGRLTDTETIADDSSPQVLWNTSVDYDVVNYTGPFRGVEQTTTDEEDDVTDHISDVHGNLAKVIEYDGSTPINTSYGYDGAGRLTSVTNSGDTTTIGYDYGGRKTSLTDPDMGSWSYTYDVFGNLATQADGRNKKLAFAYDDHDRLTRKHRTTTSGYKLAEWFYDATNQVGLLDRSVAYEDPNGDGTVDYTVTVDPQGYDARNRVTSTTWTIDGSSYTVDWTYDPADRMETITYPTVGGDEEIVKYVYDDTNRGLPSGSTSDKPTSNTPLVSAVSWNERGAPLAQTWGSGSNAVARVWEYQTDTLRLNKLEAGTGASTTNRQNLAFSYFDDGNVQWIKDYGNSSQRQCFEYDDLSRLTDAYTIDAGCTGIADWSNSVGVGPYRRQYRYEDNGNIDEVSTAGGSWDDYSYGAGSAGPHAATSYLGWSYTYDANGNMETRTKSGVSDDDLSFDWNNRLGKYVADDGTATATWLVYDADGTRVARIVDGGDATHYVGGIFEITNPAGSSTSRSYYSFNGQTVGYRYRTSIVDERRFLLSDHLGTNATEVNEASGAVTEQYYLPYGDLRGATSNGLGTDRTYTGQTTDVSTGLMFYNARYYLPALRRFISADTIVPDPGNPQDLNRYTYVANNPVNAADPSGHGSCGGRGACRGAGGGDSDPILIHTGTRAVGTDDPGRRDVLGEATGRQIALFPESPYRPHNLTEATAMVAACELACGFSVKTWPGTVGMTDLFVYSWAIELLANESDSGKVDLLLDSAGAIQVGAVLQYNDELRDLVDRVLLLGPAPVPEGAFDGMDVIVLYHENDPITATWDLTEIFLGERVVSPLDIDGVRTVMSNEPRPPELDTPQERASFYHDGWWDVQIPGMFNQLADAVEGL